MPKIAQQPWFVLVVRILLAGVFLWAAIPKILSPEDFAQSISNYQMVGDPLTGVMALFLPWLEAFVAVALLLGKGIRGAAWMSFAVLLLFNGATVWVMWQGIDIECGCFGASDSSKAGAGSLLRNVGLMACAAFLLVKVSPKEKSH